MPGQGEDRAAAIAPGPTLRECLREGGAGGLFFLFLQKQFLAVGKTAVAQVLAATNGWRAIGGKLKAGGPAP